MDAYQQFSYAHYSEKNFSAVFLILSHPSSILQAREGSIMEILEGHRWNSCSESDSDEYLVFLRSLKM